MTDDADLLQRYADTRSESAFTELVERYIDLVHTAALRRLGGDSHRAADVTQQVFIALARHARTLSRRPVLVGWLYTTTRHAVLDNLRAEQRRLVREHSAHELHTMSDPGTITDEWKELRPLLDLAMDELGESDREVILLRFFEERSFVEIGTKFSITEDTARMRTHRALEKLHGLLQRRGINSTAAALGATLAGQTVSAAPAGLAAAVTGGALATATLAAGTLTLMSTTKTLLAIAGILTAAAIGSAVYEARLGQRAAHAVADLQRERDTLRTQAANLETRLNETSANLARTTALQKETAEKLAKVTAPSPILTTSEVNSVWANPDFARNYVARERASLGLRFSQLYRELHLSPEQIAKFENAQMELQQSLVDIWTEATARGLSDHDTSVIRLTTEPQTLFASTLRALLGDSGFAQYQQYQKGKAARELVTSLAGNVYFTETPLTPEQGTQLAQIIKSNTETKKTPMKDDGGKTMFSVRDEINWGAVTTQAQRLLSASQLSALKILAEQKRLQDDQMRILSPSAK